MYKAVNTKVLSGLAEHEAEMEKDCVSKWGRGYYEGRASAFEFAAQLMEEAEAEIFRLNCEIEDLKANLHHARQALDDAWGDAYREEVNDAEWEEIIDGTSIVPNYRYQREGS